MLARDLIDVFGNDLPDRDAAELTELSSLILGLLFVGG
jgi:hypothetical protein